jgi:polyisoprenoid-binding protein YceI
MLEDRLSYLSAIPDDMTANAVIPANAGAHLDLRRGPGRNIKMDPSVRWDDGRGRGTRNARFKAFCIAVLLSATLPALAADYTQAPGSSLTFAGNYQGEVFTGRFPGFRTTLSFDPAQLATSKLDVAIPLATATTGVADYDGELRGASFFNAAKFPQARYTATKFRSLGGNRYAADGTLSLRGASKPVTLTFTWTPGAKPVLAGKATVKRLDFGVGDGDWTDTDTIPNEIAVSTKVVLQSVQ